MNSVDTFDNYIYNRLSTEERTAFENRLQQDAVFSSAFNDHKKLLETLEKEAKQESIKKKLIGIHKEIFGENTKIISMFRENTFAQRHGRTIAVAASTALIAVLATVAALSTGGDLLKQQNNEILELKRNVMELKYSNDGIVEGITKKKTKAVYAPANLEGSAFALNNKGFIVTSYHMVKLADSVFIQNEMTERSHAKIIFTDPTIDLAVLKLDNAAISKNWQVPYSLKKGLAEIGEKVFTLGFPRTEVVYGEGALSSMNGYSGDTSMYQISIPVNPGNSGGPLLDEQANVIGVIKGKFTGVEAAGFAIKTNQILQSLQQNATDSLKRELLTQSKKQNLKNLKRSEQVKRINPYVFNVLVYKAE